ncbi:hypothetical protein TSOC_005916 [Tetrabaena socialis]|uniref:Uncharacterized protein n=1 Tax=Tetrabaena socialis TaxID=47790 RepID=A0A2J8A537_9CHLO|nr:hypothetical protein TSOC_005916 [Tetrabaena socialis]|eukprot:PNH07617.1 hypothetical protein TSOC_005916 [Tetrabaena socialis]
MHHGLSLSPLSRSTSANLGDHRHTITATKPHQYETITPTSRHCGGAAAARALLVVVLQPLVVLNGHLAAPAPAPPLSPDELRLLLMVPLPPPLPALPPLPLSTSDALTQLSRRAGGAWLSSISLDDSCSYNRSSIPAPKLYCSLGAAAAAAPVPYGGWPAAGGCSASGGTMPSGRPCRTQKARATSTASSPYRTSMRSLAPPPMSTVVTSSTRRSSLAPPPPAAFLAESSEWDS